MLLRFCPCVQPRASFGVGYVCTAYWCDRRYPATDQRSNRKSKPASGSGDRWMPPKSNQSCCVLTTQTRVPGSVGRFFWPILAPDIHPNATTCFDGFSKPERGSFWFSLVRVRHPLLVHGESSIDGRRIDPCACLAAAIHHQSYTHPLTYPLNFNGPAATAHQEQEAEAR